jgi:hypothetical protein
MVGVMLCELHWQEEKQIFSYCTGVPERSYKEFRKNKDRKKIEEF